MTSQEGLFNGSFEAMSLEIKSRKVPRIFTIYATHECAYFAVWIDVSK